MKKYLILFVVFISSVYGISQTITSIGNGDWTNPTTWSCNCVPLPGYTIIINHKITLNASFVFTTGGITINSDASLIDDIIGKDIWIKGGAFTNNGSVKIRFLISQSGTFSNGGTIEARAYVNSINYFNSGTFQNIGSMTNNSIITNNGSLINIDSITNNGIITNNGVSIYNQFSNNGNYSNNNKLTCTDITNNGTISNSSSITIQNSMWNQSKINNFSAGSILLNKSLLNKNFATGKAVIDNNGQIKIMDSFYNYDTIKGSNMGSVIIQDSSVNYGYLNQSFDFCDLTPPASAPFVDYNYGIISNGITWCLTTKVSEAENTKINVYPNPAITELHFDIGDAVEYKIKISNFDGSLVLTSSNLTTIDVSSFPEGLYFATIYIENKLFVRKIQIVKSK